MATPHYKDQVLDSLATDYNVAQFVSFGPDGKQRYSRVLGYSPNNTFESVAHAAVTLMSLSCGQSLNIRSFEPTDPQSRPFHYGMVHTEEVIETALLLLSQGLHIIIHETIDVNDGGVSGVLEGGIMEFAPGVTPRAVEKMMLPAIPKELGLSMLRTVYGEFLDLDLFDTHERVEFSIHPGPVGWKAGGCIIWEVQTTGHPMLPNIFWPHPFSQMIGDKAYGLMIADLLGFHVPYTKVHMRKGPIEPFAFGRRTHTDDYWTRTCPSCQTPGRFTTVHGLVPPLELMEADDPAGVLIPSCLVQEGVAAKWSGAVVTGSDNGAIIQGCEGFGDNFMQGIVRNKIPDNIHDLVMDLYEDLQEELGPTGFEWVYDGQLLWVVQLHVGKTKSLGNIIVPWGDLDIPWVDFHPSEGLPRLNELIATVFGDSDIPDGGIRVTGPVGMTSHVADILRKAKVPSEIRC